MTIEYFGDAEIFQVGMNVEKKGEAFYRNLSKMTKNPKTRRIADGLLESEKEHYALLLRLKAGLASKKNKMTVEADSEVSKYINSLIKTNIFAAMPESKFVKKISDKDALNIGIQAEKDSILFYTEAHSMSTNTSGKRALARLIKEEKEHLIILTHHLNELEGY